MNNEETNHQNILQSTEQGFRQGKIAKKEYISQMYQIHHTLFDYINFIKNRNVGSITITNEDVLVTTKSGVTMICNPHDQRITPIEILNFGDYEPAETALLLSLIDDHSTVVDIGANTGWYCINLGRKMTHGKVIAFEPIPQTRAFLRKNLALNHIENIDLREYGLSDKEEELTFFFDPQLSGATSARNIRDKSHAQKIVAKVRLMDDALGTEPRIDLIKCDVEGAELFVLRGGLKTLQRTKPPLFIEMLRKWSAKFEYHPNDIISLMASINYRCFAVNEHTITACTEINEDTLATNFLFLHKEKHNDLIKSMNNMNHEDNDAKSND